MRSCWVALGPMSSHLRWSMITWEKRMYTCMCDWVTLALLSHSILIITTTPCRHGQASDSSTVKGEVGFLLSSGYPPISNFHSITLCPSHSSHRAPGLAVTSIHVSDFYQPEDCPTLEMAGAAVTVHVLNLRLVFPRRTSLELPGTLHSPLDDISPTL